MTDYAVEDQSFVAGEALLPGDFCKLDANGEAVKVDAAESTECVGVVVSTPRPTSGGGFDSFGADAGDRVTLRMRGEVKLWALVEDTDSMAGYDNPISPGDNLLISGKAAGTRTPGQAVSSFGGTGQSAADSGLIKVGRALEAEAGSTTADTFSQIRCYVDFL